MRGWRAATIAALAVTGVTPAGAAAHGGHAVRIDVLSSRPDQVSGGDALVRVQAPVSPRGARRAQRRRGHGHAASERRRAHRGYQRLRGRRQRALSRVASPHHLARLRVVNHPITGPIFSGPQQPPFVCKTNQTQPPLNDSLGEPIVDNQAGEGFRVLAPTGRPPAGAATAAPARSSTTSTARPAARSRRCPPGRTARPTWRRPRRSTAGRSTSSSAASAARSTASSTPTRCSRRSARRTTRTAVEPAAGLRFDGGVAIGHNQGTPAAPRLDPAARPGLRDRALQRHRTNTHYNLLLGGETALMTKERFIERYGVPLYTVGVGGSGGAIQQYVYGQNHPGLLDAAIPQSSPIPTWSRRPSTSATASCSSTTWTSPTRANPKWRDWDEPRVADRPERRRRRSRTPTPARPGSTSASTAGAGSRRWR